MLMGEVVDPRELLPSAKGNSISRGFSASFWDEVLLQFDWRLNMVRPKMFSTLSHKAAIAWKSNVP